MSSHRRNDTLRHFRNIIIITIRHTHNGMYNIIKSYCFIFQRELVQRRPTSATAATEQEQKTIDVSHCFVVPNIIHIKCILKLLYIYVCVCIVLCQVKSKIIIVTNLYIIYILNTYYDVILNKI